MREERQMGEVEKDRTARVNGVAGGGSWKEKKEYQALEKPACSCDAHLIPGNDLWYFHTEVWQCARHPGCVNALWAGCLIIFLALSIHFLALLPSEKGSTSVAKRTQTSSR